MGLALMSTGSADDRTPIRAGNPVPYRFRIRKKYRSGTAIAVRVHYPDCKNYEGDKVLVFQSAAAFDACVAKRSLDPHFFEGDASPIARFRPDDMGWTFACALADGLGGKA